MVIWQLPLPSWRYFLKTVLKLTEDMAQRTNSSTKIRNRESVYNRVSMAADVLSSGYKGVRWG